MAEFTPQESDNRKKMIFDSMSERRQKHILKKGYDKWNPFAEPKDPIDIRKDPTRRTSKMLIREFLQSYPDDCTTQFSSGALEICLGIINDDERYQGMFEFACWYYDLLKKEGHRK